MIKIPEPKNNSRLGEVPYYFNGQLGLLGIHVLLGAAFFKLQPPVFFFPGGGRVVKGNL